MKLLQQTSMLMGIVFVTACGGGSDVPIDEDRGYVESQDFSGELILDDGVQVIQVEAGMMGFQPSEIVIQAGIPARLVFTRTADSSCSEHIQIPDYGIGKTELPLDEPVAFEIAPEQEGSVKFVCGMDMQSGTIVVRS